MSTTPHLALFDFADTLAELKPSRQDILAEHIERISGIQIGADAIARSYKAADLIMKYSSVLIRTKAQRAEFYQEYNRHLLALLGISHLVDPAELFSVFSAHKKHWQLKSDACDTLNELRQRGYRIGIISNFDTRLEQIVYDHLDLASTVDYLHVSQSEGIEKPDLQFYLGFFKKYDIAIEHSFYVGDNYVLDFLPARSIGLKTWLLDEAGLYAHLPEAITSMGDVLQRIPQ